MDKTNHHLHKPVMIGEIEGNGQFDVVWKTSKALRGHLWFARRYQYGAR